MSFITLKNEFNNEDILACRACLATDRKLYSIYQDEIVLKSYKNLIGSEVYPYDTLPQYVCNYCAILLLKYNTFQDDCQRANRYLEDARIIDTIITQEYLSNFKSKVQYKKTATKHINYYNINYIESDTNFITDNSNDNYNNDYTSLDTENSQMDTQNIVIKKEINTPIIDIQLQNRTIGEKKSSLDTENSQMDTQKIEIKNEANTLIIEDIDLLNKNTENLKKIKKKGKYFETKDNMDDFEKSFNVQIVILSKEQQFKDVLERKNSTNYLQSPYRCENCYKGYMSEEILKKHILSQHDKSRGDIVCEFCKFRYKDRRGLNHHLKTHRLKFICKQCAYVSRTTFNAKEHFKMHGGQVHQCNHCGKSHEKLSSHLSHIRLQHPSSLVWCHICAQACVGEFGLNAHMKKAHRHFPLPVSCATCKTHFVSHTALTRHSRAALCSEHSCVHCGDAYDDAMFPLPYSCATCGSHFVSHTALTRHSSAALCSEHSCVHCGDAYDDAVALREHLSVHQSERVFQCEKCDKTFKRENLYSAHYKRIHVDNEDKSMKKKEKPWICEVCGKTLPNKSLLLYHQRNHTGEKPYRCTQCTKSFTMRKLLQSHLRVHTNDRPYSCKLCPKTFKGLSALRGHEYIHTGQTKISSKNRVIK